MRLLSEYMSVPERNSAVPKNTPGQPTATGVLPSKEIQSTDNKNFLLTRRVEETREHLIHLLAQFPITALWLLNKNDLQISNTGESEDDMAGTVDLGPLVKELNTVFSDLITNQSQTGLKSFLTQQKIFPVIKQFPLGFEELVKLVDLLGFILKDRQLDFSSCNLSNKQSALIKVRMAKLSDCKTANLPSLLKRLETHLFDTEFLFLTGAEMPNALAAIVLAEEEWLQARQKLACANAKLVLFIANQYKGNFLEFEDLVQEGQTGLLKAVDRFKYRLGFQFSTYAGYWIRQAISRALSRSERVVRIPCGQIAVINKVYRVKEELTLKYGHEPSDKELAEQTQLSLEEVNSVLAISQTAVPLESFDDEEEDPGFAPIDFLEQQVFTTSYQMIAETQLEKLIKGALKTLNPREYKILSAHFGLLSDSPKTLQEIGAELNLTRERVRQIQVVALNKIKSRYGEQLCSFL